MSASTTQLGKTALATAELDYELPEALIATRPAEPRDTARLLVMSRSSEAIEHAHVRDLSRYLRAGDSLVFNTTAVAPARLVGIRVGTGGRIEGLFLCGVPSSNGQHHWRVMLHAGGRLRPGDRIELTPHGAGTAAITIELIERRDADWVVRVDGSRPERALDAIGLTPLPPYILKARGDMVVDDQQDRDWYQTVYADAAARKSVAAPTAGLHFTPQLLDQLQCSGVQRIDVTLHVGAGTFKPISASTLAEHRMHTEEYFVRPEALRAIAAHRAVRRKGGSSRLFAVGTTSVRTLESINWDRLNASALSEGVRGSTDLLIAPPYEFACVDGLLTNFHLPRSTLLALVAAMVGLDRLKAVYQIAVDKGYRFYSYGDAMLILP